MEADSFARAIDKVRFGQNAKKLNLRIFPSDWLRKRTSAQGCFLSAEGALMPSRKG